METPSQAFAKYDYGTQEEKNHEDAKEQRNSDDDDDDIEAEHADCVSPLGNVRNSSNISSGNRNTNNSSITVRFNHSDSTDSVSV
jgi:hypothetical protein